jgi:ornithine carbamoyltransferase
VKNRSLLSVRDLNLSEIRHLFEETRRLKKSKGNSHPLRGKTLGLLFEKPSVRTRLSFEVAMAQLGGHAIYLGPLECGGGAREAAKDLGQVLSRYLDGIVARTFSHRQAEELARNATVPVINGLSDLHHPCQALGDLFTMEEKLKKLTAIRLGYVGDGNNVCHSLLEACALLGVQMRVATPRGYEPSRTISPKILLTHDPVEAVRGANIVYTDVWTSMGQEKERHRRLRAFRGFQVNRSLMRQAAPGALFMHCLPAHRGEEVTDEVIDSPRSIVYDQAENRLHVQKAILLFLLGGAARRR